MQQLRDFAGAFARQAFVVAVALGEARRQRLGVRMADQMQPHVLLVAHAIERLTQVRERAVGYFGDARLEVDRRHDVVQLHRLRRGDDDFAGHQFVAGLRREAFRVARPLHELLVARQLALDAFTEGRFGNVRRMQRVAAATRHMQSNVFG